MIKNINKYMNRIFILIGFWILWVHFIFKPFMGTDLGMLLWFIGFCITLCYGAFISDTLNYKELKFIAKIKRIIEGRK